jgi:hypothetical protein
MGFAQERILREAHVQPVAMGARTMRGFVRVAPEGYRTDAALAAWVDRGVEAAGSRPKKSPRAKPRRAPKKF